VGLPEGRAMTKSAAPRDSVEVCEPFRSLVPPKMIKFKNKQFLPEFFYFICNTNTEAARENFGLHQCSSLIIYKLLLL
jgi:hypothetical protein